MDAPKREGKYGSKLSDGQPAHLPSLLNFAPDANSTLKKSYSKKKDLKYNKLL